METTPPANSMARLRASKGDACLNVVAKFVAAGDIEGTPRGSTPHGVLPKS